MKNLIINEIIRLNKKVVKLDFGQPTDDAAKWVLGYASDKLLLGIYDTLVRFDEEMNLRKFITDGKLPIE